MTPSVPQLFSGSLRPFPGVPEKWSVAKRTVASVILADVKRVFPQMCTEIVPGADIEDFWEDACRVSAVWHQTGRDRLVVKEPGTMVAPWTPEEMNRRLGPVAIAEDGGHHGVDKLLGHALVQKHGGRAMLRGSLGGNPRTDVVQWLASRHRDHGVQYGVVKAAGNKSGVWSVKLDSDPVVIAERLLEEMDWTFIHLEELAGGVLAQDALELQWEYRLFVVDGEVVSGAGCIEEFTPLDGKTCPFDTRVRRVRGHLATTGSAAEPSPVEDRPAIVRRLIEFGQTVAQEHGGTVVIDVAIDAATDQPVVIELNGIANSGLYASDPWVVTEKLVQARDRGYLLQRPSLHHSPDPHRLSKEHHHEQVRSRSPRPHPLRKALPRVTERRLRVLPHRRIQALQPTHRAPPEAPQRLRAAGLSHEPAHHHRRRRRHPR